MAVAERLFISVDCVLHQVTTAGSGISRQPRSWTEEEVLRREGFDHDRVSRFLDDLAARANRTVIYFLTRPALLDADDDFLLELAVASASEVIVTFNVRDSWQHAPLVSAFLLPRHFWLE